MRISDWSSDVCSSDLRRPRFGQHRRLRPGMEQARLADRLRCRILLLLGERGLQHGLGQRGGGRCAAGRCAGDVTLADLGVDADPGRSEEHTSELQSLMRTSYAVFCLKKKHKKITNQPYS